MAAYDMVMSSFIERDGVRYRRTSVEIREDLHVKAKEQKINITAFLNNALEKKMKEEK